MQRHSGRYYFIFLVDIYECKILISRFDDFDATLPPKSLFRISSNISLRAYDEYTRC